MKNFKELLVWRKAHQMTLEVYEATRGFPKEELYGLTSQLSPFGGFDRREHRRRIREALQQRDLSLSPDSARLR